MSKPNEFAQACLDRLIPELVGLTITGGAVDDTGEYWGFVVEGGTGRKPINKVIFVLCDSEGNGSGWLEINEGEKEI